MINLNPIRNEQSNNLTFNGRKMYKIYPSKHQDEFVQIRKTYNQLWEELGLPTKLKPILQFRSIYSEMSFNLTKYAIIVNKNTPKRTLKVRNITGENKATLRHEIEHVLQIWDIIRLKGTQKIAEDLKISSNRFIRKARKVEKILGKHTPKSPQVENAKKYYNAIMNYTSCNKTYPRISIKEYTDYYKYYNNDLEKGARRAAKKYTPNIFTVIKETIKEYLRHKIPKPLLKIIKLTNSL